MSRRSGWWQVVLLWVLARPLVALALVAAVTALAVLGGPWSLQGPIGYVLACGVLLGGLSLVPLFAPPPPGRAVRPDVEPELTDLVAQVAAVIGIRVPVAVRVVPTVDAALSTVPARLGGGLVLVLGWPLLRRLTRQQLAAVVAHEFGHEVHAFSRLDRTLLSARNDLLESLDRRVHVPRSWARRALAPTRARVWELETAADRTSVDVAGAEAAGAALVEVHRAGVGFGLFLDAWMSVLGPRGNYPEDLYDALDAVLANPYTRARVDDETALAEAFERSAPDLMTHPPSSARLAALTSAGGAGALDAGGAAAPADVPVPVHEAAEIDAWCTEQLFDPDGDAQLRPERLLDLPPERLDPPPEPAFDELRAVTGAGTDREAVARTVDALSSGAWVDLVEAVEPTRGLPEPVRERLRTQLLGGLVGTVVSAHLRSAGWRRGDRWSSSVVAGPDGEVLDVRTLVADAARTGDTARLRELLATPVEGVHQP